MINFQIQHCTNDIYVKDWCGKRCARFRFPKCVEFYHLRIPRGFTLVNFSAFAWLSRTDRSNLEFLRSGHVTWSYDQYYFCRWILNSATISNSESKKCWPDSRTRTNRDERERSDVIREPTNLSKTSEKKFYIKSCWTTHFNITNNMFACINKLTIIWCFVFAKKQFSCIFS